MVIQFNYGRIEQWSENKIGHRGYEEDHGEVKAVPISPRNASLVLQVCGLPSSTINFEGTVFGSI